MRPRYFGLTVVHSAAGEADHESRAGPKQKLKKSPSRAGDAGLTEVGFPISRRDSLAASARFISRQREQVASRDAF